MDYMQSFAISAAGMNVERMRVDVAALNLANANTVQGMGGSSYQPLRVLAEAQSPSGADGGGFGALVRQGLEGGDLASQAGPTARIVPADVASRQVYEPGHPLANERGFVAYAAVDTATEMVSMMSATRAYEANVSAMNTARTLALRTLDIGSNA
ncbi:flagellar basal-body rod protein FlgC [Variovorax boronicumulans]|uniref:flagellar basal body rod protein FlgC n=1 Tax=Variovorax boronicumulans TaxID=436515 RepID=UPI00278B1DB3|nr:flagellar basal body rod protein FlgC [Variovorax boronicumulans]MDQ0086092.1 flagellar basal-body rod protein FlgC [Variovorax boronicumulans]